MTREPERRSRAGEKVMRRRGRPLLRPLSDSVRLEMDGGGEATSTFDPTRNDCEPIAEAMDWRPRARIGTPFDHEDGFEP